MLYGIRGSEPMRNKMTKRRWRFLGYGLLAVFLFTAIFAPQLAPFDPREMGTPYEAPSAVHWLGTNDIGQDIFSELLYGSRISLFIGFVAACVISCIGTGLGVSAAYYGGFWDRAVMGLSNVAIVVPDLPLMLLLIAYLGNGLGPVIFVLCLTSWAGFARLVRARVLSVKEMEFVQMERVLGLSSSRILWRHILPHVRDLVLTKGCLVMVSSMMAEAGLSFLGLGVAGQVSWGNMLHYAFFRDGVLNHFYWWYLPPVLCISGCAMGIMLIGSNIDDST